MDYKCHIYQIPGVSNMRDLGGYKTNDGRKIVKGRFIRSTALAKVDADGETQLRKIGVDCVIDLRSTLERKHAPDIIEQSNDIHFLHVPMLDYISSNFVKKDFKDFPKSMHEMYIGLIDNAGGDFKRVFEAFADERFLRYLYHCTAGKDRTGVATMLLLGLADVPDETIIEDYSYTESLLDSAPMGLSLPNMPKYLFESNPETMRLTIAYIRAKYGSIPQYLENIGIAHKLQQEIKAKLFNTAFIS